MPVASTFTVAVSSAGNQCGAVADARTRTRSRWGACSKTSCSIRFAPSTTSSAESAALRRVNTCSVLTSLSIAHIAMRCANAAQSVVPLLADSRTKKRFPRGNITIFRQHVGAIQPFPMNPLIFTPEEVAKFVRKSEGFASQVKIVTHYGQQELGVKEVWLKEGVLFISVEGENL